MNYRSWQHKKCSVADHISSEGHKIMFWDIRILENISLHHVLEIYKCHIILTKKKA